MEDETEEELSLSTVTLPRPSPTHGERKDVASANEETVAAVLVPKGFSPPPKPAMITGGMVQVSRPSEVLPQREDHRRGSVSGRFVKLSIESTWEDREFCGLTGVEVLLDDGSVAKVGKADVLGEPHGLSVLGYDGDVRTPDKLVDGVNNTTDEEHMWLFPFTLGSRHELRIDLGSTKTMSGLRVWNYNKSFESARSRGAKQVTIHIDDEPLFRCLLRPVS